jgi:hypothetical protein
MIDVRIPCALALSMALAVACSEPSSAGAAGATGSGGSAGAAPEEIGADEVQDALEEAIDAADEEITADNAADELRRLEGEIDGGG